MTKLALPGAQMFRVIKYIRFLTALSSGVAFRMLTFQLYLETRSVLALALAFMSISVPALIINPLARGIAQRLGPRLALICGNVGVLFAMTAMLLLLWYDQLVPWQVYLLTAIRIIFVSINTPAQLMLARALLPEDQIEQVNQQTAIADSVVEVVEPVLAGVGLVTIGLASTLEIHVLFLLGFIVALLMIRVPRSAAVEPAPTSPIDDMLEGWRYISARPGLLGLLCFFAVTNIAVSMILVLIIPLGLLITSPWLFGLVLSLACLGPLPGILAFTRLKNRRSMLPLIFGGTLLQGLLLIIGGVRPSLWMIGLATFGFLVCNPIVIGASHEMWERKVPLAVHRRALTLRRTIAWSTLPLGQCMAGLLADKVFVPASLPNSVLANGVGSLTGAGPTRGLGLFIAALGILVIMAVVVGYAYPRLRGIEEELPDVAGRESLMEAHLTVTNAF